MPTYRVGAPRVDATGDIEPTAVPGGSGGVAPSAGGVGTLPRCGSVRRDLSTDRVIEVEQPNSRYIFQRDRGRGYAGHGNHWRWDKGRHEWKGYGSE